MAEETEATEVMAAIEEEETMKTLMTTLKMEETMETMVALLLLLTNYLEMIGMTRLPKPSSTRSGVGSWQIQLAFRLTITTKCISYSNRGQVFQLAASQIR